MEDKEFNERMNRMARFEEILNRMFNFKDNSDNPVNTNLESKLGQPTSVERFEEGGFHYEEKTWKTEEGTYVSIEMVEHPINKKSKPLFKVDEKTLEERLKDAEEDQNYELCAKLRDLIKEKK